MIVSVPMFSVNFSKLWCISIYGSPGTHGPRWSSNIKNFRYVEDTTLMAESEEELKSLLMKVKEESEKLA